MNPVMCVLLMGSLLISGCASYFVERESTGDDKGSLALQAVREEGSRPKRGYVFQVTRDDVAIGSFQSQSGAPTVVADLEPGEYTIIVSGRKIDPHDFSVEVHPDYRTVVSVLISNVRRSTQVLTIAEYTGKAILYTAGIVIFLAVLLVLEIIDDDDECGRCGWDPCRCPG